MNIKDRLRWALISLFLVILCLGGIGTYYLKKLADQSANIIKDNNRTLTYMRAIDKNLDQVLILLEEDSANLAGVETQLDNIKNQIDLQLANITEAGEQQTSNQLLESFKRLKVLFQKEGKPRPGVVLGVISQIKDYTASIYFMNEDTMLMKNRNAQATADRIMLFMAIFCISAILISLFFIYALPLYISKPLETIEDSINEISKGNYNVQIPIKSKDEYGKIASSFNTMTAKLNEFEKSNLSKLLTEQKRMNALINQLDEVVIGLDEDKKIIFINEHGLAVLGMKREQLMHKFAPELASKNELLNNLIQELMIPFLPDEEKVYKPIKIVENGKEKLFSKNIVDIHEKPTGENNTKLKGHVIILSDITAYEEKDKQKTYFISTLSHELKTPVSAINMSANLLKNAKTGNMNEEQLDLLQTIENNNERIKRTINEILDISKIESGTIDVYKEEYDAEKLIDTAIDGVSLFLKDKGLQVTKNVKGVHSLIHVDAHKLVWILNNFLTNAIRYAPEGSALQVKATMEADFVRISVIDEGKGIEKNNQKKLFTKFTQLDIPEQRKGGSGLGLAISKEFIEAMGGKIGLKSESGKGSEFWVECPIAK
jgi:NtrC-family two-component system sensor histidine kinase KinB